MEKKIKFQDVVNFIERAMSLNCTIDVYHYKELDMYSTLYIITKISKDEHKGREINWKQENDKLYINLCHSSYSEKLSDYIIEVENRKDILKWETLIEEITEYAHYKLEIEFENFFNNEYKPTDINDLDDKED